MAPLTIGRVKRSTAITLFSCVFIILCIQQGCFRRAVLRIKNKSMEGKSAPGLTSAEWILPAGQAAPPAAMTKRWTLLAFFKPT